MAQQNATPPEQQEMPPMDLASIEAEHGRWLASRGKEGKRANLRGLDFSHADLSGRHFMEASLRGAILTGANLKGADLRAADLSEADLTDADLSGAQAAGASFTRAQLSRANLSGADMGAANFTAAMAEGLNASDAKLGGAILREANLHRAVLLRAQLRDANLRGANCSEAELGSADLSAADCRDANFDQARFNGAVLQGTNFRGARFASVDMQAADFASALDVAAEVMAQAAHTERGKLQEEHARISGIKSNLDLREKELTDMKQQLEGEAVRIAGVQETQADMAYMLAKLSRSVMASAILWMAFAGTIFAFTLNVAMQLEHLQADRVVFILAGSGFAIALALFCMLRLLQITRLMKRIGAAIDEPQDAVLPERVKVAKPASGKRMGFGKRK